MLTATIADAASAPAAGILPALAQDMSAAPVGARWIAIAVSILIVACVVMASLKSAKRTHQD